MERDYIGNLGDRDNKQTIKLIVAYIIVNDIHGIKCLSKLQIFMMKL